VIIICAQPVAEQAPDVSDINFEHLEQIGPQSGSNPGGKYKHGPTGQEWYVKWDRSGRNDRMQNELLAAKLYELAGVKVPEMRAVKMPQGVMGLASKIVPNLKSDPEAIRAHRDVAMGFAADAWLGNWDVVGLEYDNLLHQGHTGDVYRVDTGGAMLYRAMGAEKGHLFGDEATEIESLRDPDVNRNAASVFGGLSQKEINDSIQRVLAIPDQAIVKAVMAYGPGDEAKKGQLADRLVKRKNSLKAHLR